MAARPEPGDTVLPRRNVRCRCGHLPTHHMVVMAIAGSASFRLEPTGPCAICGEAVCHRYTPGPRDAAVSRTPA